MIGKLSTLKLFDSTFGKVACKCFLSRNPVTSQPIVQNVLFIRPGGIGDAVLLIPAINALRQRFPLAIIDVLAEKRNSSIYSLCSAVNRTFHYDKATELLRVICGKYDVVIDTEQWHRLSAVVARMTRAPISIGFATNDRKKLLTHSIAYSHDEYEVNSFLRLLTPLMDPLSTALSEPFLTIPIEMASSIRSRLCPLGNKKVLALFPGGSIRERQWGSDRFRELAVRFIALGYGIVAVGGTGDIQAGKDIADALPNVINYCGKLTLIETAAVLKDVDLLITGDSGIMHIGYGLGTKTLSLFGPGIEKKWSPKEKKYLTINKNMVCSPCTKFGYTPKCKKNAACMKEISVDEVFAKAIKLLEG